jgi:hypothetical protein
VTNVLPIGLPSWLLLKILAAIRYINYSKSNIWRRKSKLDLEVAYYYQLLCAILI